MKVRFRQVIMKVKKHMEKTKIKRVHKHKRKITTKEKIFAGLGLASNLLGGGGGVAAQKSATRIVAKNTHSSENSLVNKVFGIKTAHASLNVQTAAADAATLGVDEMLSRYAPDGDSTELFTSLGNYFQDSRNIPSVFSQNSFASYILGLQGMENSGQVGNLRFNGGQWINTLAASSLITQNPQNVGLVSEQPSGNLPPAGSGYENYENENENNGGGPSTTNSQGGTVSRVLVDSQSFDLRVGQSASTRVFVDYLMQDGTYAQDHRVNVTSLNPSIASAGIGSEGQINISAVMAGQTVITVHPLGMGSDNSKDARIFVRVSTEDTSVSSLKILDSQSRQINDTISVANNTSLNLSALVELSDGTRSPNVVVTPEDLSQSNIATISSDANGLIRVQAYDPFVSSDLENQTFSAAFRIHPAAAGNDSSKDKILNVVVYKESTNRVLPTRTVTPAYISELAGQHTLNTLNDSDLAILADYFSQQNSVLPENFIPGSFAASAIGFGEEIPSSSNGLVLYAMTLGYRFQNGRYEKSFDLPNVSDTATIRLRNPSTGQFMDNMLVGDLKKSVYFAGGIGAVAAANQIYIYLHAAVGSATRAIIVANGGLAAMSAGHALAAIWAFATNPATIAITAVEVAILLVNKYENWRRNQHYKIDDTRVIEDAMPKIIEIVDTYNNNRSTNPEDEQEMYDTCTQLIWAIFNGSVPYFKRPASIESQRVYVQAMIEGGTVPVAIPGTNNYRQETLTGMRSTLNQRLSSFDQWYNSLDVYVDSQGNRQTLIDINDTAFKHIVVSPSGEVKSETGKAVPQSLVNSIKNAEGGRLHQVAALDWNPFSNSVSSPGATQTLMLTSEYALTARVGENYNHQIGFTGGVGPFVWELANGSLPSGLSFDVNSGRITGIPAEEGQQDINIKITDSLGHTHTQQFTIFVEAGEDVGVGAAELNITYPQLVSGTVGQMYQAVQINVTGGSGPYSFAVPSGSLPSGLVMSPEGIISGTPTQSGVFTFSIEVTDSAGAIKRLDNISIAIAQGQTQTPPVVGTQVSVPNAQGSPMQINNAPVGYTFNTQMVNGQKVFNISINNGSTYTNLTLQDLLSLIQQKLASGDVLQQTEAAALQHLYYAQSYNSSSSYNAANNLQNGSAVTNRANLIQSRNPNMSWEAALSQARVEIQAEQSATNYAGGSINNQTGRASASFVNLNGSNNAFRDGQSWKLSVTGAAQNQNIYIDGTWTKPNGQVLDLHELVGNTGSTGSADVIRQISSYHTGTWNIKIMVDGQQVGGNINFNVAG